MERDISMKRHLIEDWRLRMKANQEKEKSFNEMLQTLEEKVFCVLTYFNPNIYIEFDIYRDSPIKTTQRDYCTVLNTAYIFFKKENFVICISLKISSGFFA